MSGDRGDVVQPSVVWAQTNDRLIITASISDVKSKSVNVTENSLVFRAKAGRDKLTDYEVKLDLFKQICTDEPKVTVSGREVTIYIKKKEPGKWNQLIFQTKCPWLKTDFSRWKDEDDSEPDIDGNNLPNMFSQMSNFGDDGDLDSDDEDLPDLEMPHADAEKSEENGTEDTEEKKLESIA
ncbi:hypothetical protein MN116_005529 [Schistosoma mekongi]|uniref:CS domain-containing protein n=1 Tax=Schistosoma mekongi TaxID=38744 RepID=A0AAE1ZCC6_SCHME|nr:hypothetical protein MN116_005529 [Schistosoma mekongi]